MLRDQSEHTLPPSFWALPNRRPALPMIRFPSSRPQIVVSFDYRISHSTRLAHGSTAVYNLLNVHPKRPV